MRAHRSRIDVAHLASGQEPLQVACESLVVGFESECGCHLNASQAVLPVGS
jgi:hypothetical protein